MDCDLIREETDEFDGIEILACFCISKDCAQNVIAGRESYLLVMRAFNREHFTYVLNTIIRNAIATVVSIWALK